MPNLIQAEDKPIEICCSSFIDSLINRNAYPNRNKPKASAITGTLTFWMSKKDDKIERRKIILIAKAVSYTPAMI